MQQLLFLAGLTLSLAAHAQSQLPSQRLSELRIAIRQSQPAAQVRGTPLSPPRQLSVEERAELRSQVAQQSRRPAK